MTYPITTHILNALELPDMLASAVACRIYVSIRKKTLFLAGRFEGVNG
jgi:hypothetical protein